MGLIYNRNLIQEPPTSFDEVEVLDHELARKNIKAINWDYTNPYYTWPLLSAGGAYAFAGDGRGNFNGRKTGVNAPGAIKNLQLLQVWVHKRVLPPPASKIPIPK